MAVSSSKIRPVPLILVMLAVLLACFGQYLFSRSAEPALMAVISFILGAVCLVAAERSVRRFASHKPQRPAGPGQEPREYSESYSRSGKEIDS